MCKNTFQKADFEGFFSIFGNRVIIFQMFIYTKHFSISVETHKYSIYIYVYIKICTLAQKWILNICREVEPVNQNT